MELLWWLFAIVLMAVGLIGTVLPVVPGAIIILAAAVIHQIMLGSEKSLGWWNVAALVLLTLLVLRAGICGRLFRRETIWRHEMGSFRRHARCDRRTLLSLSRIDRRSSRGRDRRRTRGREASGQRRTRGLGDIARQPRRHARQTDDRSGDGELVSGDRSRADLILPKTRSPKEDPHTESTAGHKGIYLIETVVTVVPFVRGILSTSGECGNVRADGR